MIRGLEAVINAELNVGIKLLGSNFLWTETFTLRERLDIH